MRSPDTPILRITVTPLSAATTPLPHYSVFGSDSDRQSGSMSDSDTHTYTHTNRDTDASK